MLPTHFLAMGEEITENTPIGERAVFGLQVMLIGMGVVFGVLLLLMGILYVFKLFALKNTKKPEPAAKTPAQPTPAAPSVSDTSGEDTVVAVATAAIAAARGESDCAFNVISIKKIVK